jgi:hypothetical protein
LENARSGARARGEFGDTCRSDVRFVTEKINRCKILRLNPVSLRSPDIKGDSAVPWAGFEAAIRTTQCVASQDCPIADNFIKAPGIVSHEIEFGKPSYFNLESVLRGFIRLLLIHLFLLRLLLSLFLRYRLVVLLLRNDPFVQQELQRAVVVSIRATGLSEQQYGEDRNYSC